MPTKEQIQWLWEQCGFSLSCYSHSAAWFINDKLRYCVVAEHQNPVDCLPPADLNNLERYAFPELARRGWNIHIHLVAGKRAKVVVSNVSTTHLKTSDILKDAMWWAIYKCLGGKEQSKRLGF